MGWFLVWMIVVRVDYTFSITPHERPIATATSCTEAKHTLEADLMKLNLKEGFVSFTVTCEYRS